MGELWFDSQQEQGIFCLFSLSWGPPFLFIGWVPHVLSQEIKWPGLEAEHLASPSAEVKKE
jgi:hypothetical protein